MNSASVLNSLLYLDRDFVAAAYEALKGHAPLTQVAKNEGMHAGARIPFFSAGLSAQETKTFSVSTFGMLTELFPEFEKYPSHANPPISAGAMSQTGWIEGELSVFKVVVKENSKKHDQLSDPYRIPSQDSYRIPVQPYDPVKDSETYFAIYTADEAIKIALVTTLDYFSSGIGAFLRLCETVLEKVSIPVRALVRVYGATSSFDEWIGVPLLIYESGRDG